MAKPGRIVPSQDGKYGISHDGKQPADFPHDSEEQAGRERDRIYAKSVQIERTCAGGGTTGVTAPHLDHIDD